MRALRPAVAAALAALLCGAGCAEDVPEGVPHSLLLVVIDTLRADHLSCYGYEFQTSPTLDSLAAAGTRFDQAMTPVPVTLPSVTSVLTGLYPPGHGVRDNGVFVLSTEVQTLAERFRRAGFRTGAVLASAALAADRGLARGFQTYDADFTAEYPVYDETVRRMASPEIGLNRRRADVVTDRAVEVLARFGRRRSFLLVHYFDVHHFYDPPPDVARKHPGRMYDGEIAFVDREIRRLLSRLPDPGRTLVVVAGDHGEGLGDHGEPEHGFLLHDATLRVPLIVSGPGVPRGAVREDPVSLVDLEPTLGAAFSLPAPEGPRDGRVLDWARAEEPRPLYGETFRTLVSYGWSELRALRLGRWKLVRGPLRDELYDLKVDPEELEDLSPQDPAPRLAALLDEMVSGDDPASVWTAAREAEAPQERETLESLGYTGRAAGPAMPDPRPHPKDELPGWIGLQLAKAFLRSAERVAMEGRNEEAIGLLDQALSWDSTVVSVYALRGDSRLRTGDREGALKDYRRVLEREPGHVGAHSVLGRLAAEDGETQEARRHWQAVVQGSPETADAHYNLGVLATLDGESARAREHFAAFLRNAPDHPRAEDVRRMLRGSRAAE